jgi:hypothetical protein
MSNTPHIMEGHLHWVRQHFAARLTSGEGTLGTSALRDGLILLIDMRFSKPPRAIYACIESAPVEDLLRWAVMTFQVGGLVSICAEILGED